MRGVASTPVQLSVGAPSGTALTWSASPEGLTLATSPDGTAATVTGATPGLYRIKVIGTLNGMSAEASWQLVLDAAQAPNLTPRSSILLPGGNIVRAGQVVQLQAFGSAPEGAPLQWAWSSAAALSGKGDRVSFLPSEPGDVQVSLVASDGQLSSPAASVVISVPPAEVNRPPSVLLVTPFSATVERRNGVATLPIQEQASDPDGDAVQVRFISSPRNPAGASLGAAGASVTFEAFADGAYEVLVSAIDSQGDEGPAATVRILVAPPPPPTAVDADKDGFPEGVDCNDQSASIRPGAPEACGGGVDQDCDG